VLGDININIMQYGYINENGYLTSRNIEEIIENYADQKGKAQTRTITVDMQIKELSKEGWKPVDDIDENLRICEKWLYVKVIPYDAGERITFRYTKKFDIQAVKKEIKELKEELSSSDYKIIKCNEWALLSQESPYDMISLSKERQEIRNKINELEDVISKNA
jgi:hypothetical protein